jgi:hypothetical protein
MLAALSSQPALRDVGHSTNSVIYKPKMDTPLDREIAEWNASVERRKAFKKR